jgi:DnaJ-class molecular chaperone
MEASLPDYYAMLGLHQRCTLAQVRSAYRALAKQLHPDVNHAAASASARMQALNAAYEVLSDVERRQAYDVAREAAAASKIKVASKAAHPITQEVHLRVEELLRGTALEVRVKDPVAPGETELLELTIPPMTAPGTRFKLSRPAGGFVQLRVRLRPDFRFKARGADLRCDLRISPQRATLGGAEYVAGATGGRVRVEVPRRVERGAVIRIAGEGLPKPRGGRGDLLVRVQYRPEVRVTRRRA